MAKYLGSDIDHATVGKVTINLYFNKIHEEGAIHVARMFYFVKHLYLSHNLIGDTGASLLSEAVKETVSLKTLILSSCGITSRGAQDLSRGLALNSSLEKLDISDNILEDKGVSHIAEALKHNNKLKELWISLCGITDKGAASLASALSVNNSLKMLQMGGLLNAGLTEGGLSIVTQSLANNNSEFRKLVISSRFGSTVGYLRGKVNETRKRNGLQPIEIEGEYCISCVGVSYNFS